MIKKMKEFYKNNRIYSILMIVSVICLIIMASAVVIYFVNQTVSSSYGTRLKDIEKYDISKEITEIDKTLKDTKGVISSKVRLQGKIIYIDVEMEKNKTNEDIQNVALSTLKLLSDEDKSYYEMQFIFSREGMTPYMGSKSASKSVISWGNYSVDTTTTTTTKKKK